MASIKLNSQEIVSYKSSTSKHLLSSSVVFDPVLLKMLHPVIDYTYNSVNYRVHVFKSSGTFYSPVDVQNCDVIVQAGGGAGGHSVNGDGGSNGSRWNIVSNPFLSYIHANDNNGGTNVLTLNSSILHSSNVALYFWDGDSYVALNHSSSASTYDYIAPFQGFLVATSYNSGNAQTFSFTKAMQTTAGSDDAILNDVMDDGDGELHFTINQNGFNRKTELYFNENGSDGLDLGYDAAAFSTMNTYLSTRLVDDSANEGENFSIQTLSIDDMWQKTIPLVVNA